MLVIIIIRHSCTSTREFLSQTDLDVFNFSLAAAPDGKTSHLHVTQLLHQSIEKIKLSTKSTIVELFLDFSGTERTAVVVSVFFFLFFFSLFFDYIRIMNTVRIRNNGRKLRSSLNTIGYLLFYRGKHIKRENRNNQVGIR